MHLFIHALGASAGGGLTYLRNLAPQLAERSDLTTTLLTGEAAASVLHSSGNLRILTGDMERRGTFSRFWREQVEIPRMIRNVAADVLLSAGNFAVWNSPVPQILLSRN